jgi:hypothetical protein
MLQRIRLTMQNGTFSKLSGEVEVDESYIGGKARNMHQPQTPTDGRQRWWHRRENGNSRNA